MSWDDLYNASYICEMREMAINLGVEKLEAGGNDYWVKKASKEVLVKFCGAEHKAKSKNELVLVVAGLLDGIDSSEQARRLEASRQAALKVHSRVAFLGRTERATASCVLAGDKETKFRSGELRIGFIVRSNYDDGKMQPKWCDLRRFFNTSPGDMATLVDAKRLKIKENIRVVLPASLQGLLVPTPLLAGGSGQAPVGDISESELAIVTNLYAAYLASYPESAANEAKMAAEEKQEQEEERARFDIMYQRQKEDDRKRAEGIEAYCAANPDKHTLRVKKPAAPVAIALPPAPVPAAACIEIAGPASSLQPSLYSPSKRQRL